MNKSLMSILTMNLKNLLMIIRNSINIRLILVKLRIDIDKMNLSFGT